MLINHRKYHSSKSFQFVQIAISTCQWQRRIHLTQKTEFPLLTTLPLVKILNYGTSIEELVRYLLTLNWRYIRILVKERFCCHEKQHVFEKRPKRMGDNWDPVENRQLPRNSQHLWRYFSPFKTLMNVIYSILMKSVEVDEILHFWTFSWCLNQTENYHFISYLNCKYCSAWRLRQNALHLWQKHLPLVDSN